MIYEANELSRKPAATSPPRCHRREKKEVWEGGRVGRNMADDATETDVADTTELLEASVAVAS